MSRSRRRESSSRSPKQNWLVIAFAAVGVIGLMAATVMVMAAAPPDRAESLCLVDEAPSSVVVVVVDASGEFTQVQQAAMLDRFYRALDRLAPSEDPSRPVGPNVRVDVYNANAPLGGLIEPVFSRCSTPKLSGLQFLAGNAERERREYADEFAEPLRATMEALVAGASTETSPVLESLTASVEQSLTGRSSEQDHSVIVISDLLQNSRTMTFYGHQSVPDFAEFNTSSGRNAVSPDLRGAKLCPILINRPNEIEDRLQSYRLFVWWEQYTTAMRGRFDGWCLEELQL